LLRRTAADGDQQQIGYDPVNESRAIGNHPGDWLVLKKVFGEASVFLQKRITHAPQCPLAKNSTMIAYLPTRCWTLAITCLIGWPLISSAEPPRGVTNSIGMSFVRIPRGSFIMGSPEHERNRRTDEQQHEVTISRDYYLGTYEVTQAQYEQLIGDNPSRFQPERLGGDNALNPVETVSWDDAVEFCRRLSELPEEKAAGRVYRLPTEAEWEYACRAGSETAYSFGETPDSLAEYGWFDDNSGKRTQPVGQKLPNAWGLYDMHGNVWEWCADWKGDYPSGAVTAPVGPADGEARVARGGCWMYVASLCRSAGRYAYPPSYRYRNVGFRVVLISEASDRSDR